MVDLPPLPDIPRIPIYESLVGQPMNLQWVRWFNEFDRTYGDPLAGLTANRIVASDASALLQSVLDLSVWVLGTAGEITATGNADGTVTLSLGGGALVVAHGGTGVTSLTEDAFLLGGSTVATLGPGTDGQLPIGDTGSTPVLATLTAGSGISIANGGGSITISTLPSITTKTTSYTTIGTDRTILVDTSSGAVTITLDASADTGQVHTIKCIDDTNACTIARNGKTIDGDSTDLTLIEDEVAILQADSSNNWWLI